MEAETTVDMDGATFSVVHARDIPEALRIKSMRFTGPPRLMRDWGRLRWNWITQAMRAICYAD